MSDVISTLKSRRKELALELGRITKPSRSFQTAAAAPVLTERQHMHTYQSRCQRP